jgi:Mrp family chromosome partitioning ATPase
MQQAAQQQQTREASQWLAGEIGNMRAKVADAESKIEEYRAKQNLYGGTNNSSLPSQQLTEINSQIATARGQEADLEARAKQLRALLKSGRSIEASDIANSETMRRLTEQRVALRAQLAEQSSTLLDQHPRIKELRAQVAELDSQIRAEGERLARQLENDAKVASDRVASLQQSLDQVKKLASRTNEQDVELRALEREAKTQRDLLESYLAKYREAVARDNINAAPPEARVISTASAAIKPAYPRKLPIVLIAAFAALTLSAGFTVTSEMLSPSAGYSYPAAPYMTAPSLAPAMPAVAVASPPFVSPVPPVQPMQAAPHVPAEPHVLQYPPSVAPMRAPLSVSTMDQIIGWTRQSGAAGRRVAVAGSDRNVGTTYAAITLARALAQQSSVALIDLAFSAPNLSVLSTDPNAPGIAELLRGTASFGEVITRDQFSSVHVVATGDAAGEGAALASAPMLPAIVDALLQSYDFVIIDAGAIAETAPEHIAALAGCAVLVTGDVAGAGARNARERMAAAGFGEVAVLVGGAAMAAA